MMAKEVEITCLAELVPEALPAGWTPERYFEFRWPGCDFLFLPECIHLGDMVLAYPFVNIVFYTLLKHQGIAPCREPLEALEGEDGKLYHLPVRGADSEAELA